VGDEFALPFMLYPSKPWDRSRTSRGFIAAGDFNHDGRQDLGVANGGFIGSGVGVLLGNGNGTFQPEIDYSTDISSCCVLVLDMNRDGKQDLVVGGVGNAARVLLGNGDGTFQVHHDFGAVTTYAYEFNDENAPPAQSSFGGLLTFPLGAYHTAELQYLFKNFDFFGIFSPLSNKQKKLSAAMISYWTQFAKTGDPNSPGRATWHPYSTSNDEFQSLIPPVPMAEHNFDSAHHCSTFWDTF